MRRPGCDGIATRPERRSASRTPPCNHPWRAFAAGGLKPQGDMLITEPRPLHPSAAPAAPTGAPGHRAFSPRQAARIAGVAYLVTNATSLFSEFVVRAKLIVPGEAAVTAANIIANAQLFRLGIFLDLITCAGVVVLNLALYELLAPVHRSLARLAALWRLTESSVYGAVVVIHFLALSILTGPTYSRVFEPGQLHALARLFIGVRTQGFWISMLFLTLGSMVYFYLLFRSRYIPRALAFTGVAGTALGVLYILARLAFPAYLAAASTAVLSLPAAALVPLALVIAPIMSFEFTIGLWLLVKGVRLPENG